MSIKHHKPPPPADLLESLSNHVGPKSDDPCLATIKKTWVQQNPQTDRHELVLASSQRVPPDSQVGTLRRFTRSLMRKIDRFPINADQASITIQPAHTDPLVAVNNLVGINLEQLSLIRSEIPKRIGIVPDEQTLLSISLGAARWSFLTIYLNRRPIDPESTLVLREHLRSIGVHLRLVVRQPSLLTARVNTSKRSETTSPTRFASRITPEQEIAIPTLSNQAITDCTSLNSISNDSDRTRRPEDIQYIEPINPDTRAIRSIICVPVGEDRPAILVPGTPKICIGLSTQVAEDNTVERREVGLVRALNTCAFTRYTASQIALYNPANKDQDKQTSSLNESLDGADGAHIDQLFRTRELALRLLPLHGPTATGTRLKLDPAADEVTKDTEQLSMGILIEALFDFTSSHILRWRDSIANSETRPSVVVSRPTWIWTQDLKKVCEALSMTAQNLPSPAERSTITALLKDADQEKLIPYLNKSVIKAFCNRQRVVLSPREHSRLGDRIRIKANSIIGRINNLNITSALLGAEPIKTTVIQPLLDHMHTTPQVDLAQHPELRQALDHYGTEIRRQLARL